MECVIKQIKTVLVNDSVIHFVLCLLKAFVSGFCKGRQVYVRKSLKMQNLFFFKIKVNKERLVKGTTVYRCFRTLTDNIN